MNRDRFNWALFVLHLTWPVLFLGLLFDTSSNFVSLYKNTNQLLFLSRQLTDNSLRTQQTIMQTRLQSDDLQFLQNLFNFFPKTEGYVRTQSALMDDVQALRKKINRKLGGKTHILVDSKANLLFLKNGAKLIWKADCSVGRGGIFQDKKSGRRWEFVTPRGKFRVLSKTENPVWIKPDWAFYEDKAAPPPPDSPERRVEGELGAYLLNLGDGYLIHGTKREDLLGKPASHGCIRLGAGPLKDLYEAVPVGTEVFIY